MGVALREIGQKDMALREPFAYGQCTNHIAH